MMRKKSCSLFCWGSFKLSEMSWKHLSSWGKDAHCFLLHLAEETMSLPLGKERCNVPPQFLAAAAPMAAIGLSSLLYHHKHPYCTEIHTHINFDPTQRFFFSLIQYLSKNPSVSAVRLSLSSSPIPHIHPWPPDVLHHGQGGGLILNSIQIFCITLIHRNICWCEPHFSHYAHFFLHKLKHKPWGVETSIPVSL